MVNGVASNIKEEVSKDEEEEEVAVVVVGTNVVGTKVTKVTKVVVGTKVTKVGTKEMVGITKAPLLRDAGDKGRPSLPGGMQTRLS